MPVGGDQFDNGARIERLGAGRVIMRKKFRSEKVAEELRKILENPGYTNNAEKAGRIIRDENGVATACDAIERRLA